MFTDENDDIMDLAHYWKKLTSGVIRSFNFGLQTTQTTMAPWCDGPGDLGLVGRHLDSGLPGGSCRDVELRHGSPGGSTRHQLHLGRQGWENVVFEA